MPETLHLEEVCPWERGMDHALPCCDLCEESPILRPGGTDVDDWYRVVPSYLLVCGECVKEI